MHKNSKHIMEAILSILDHISDIEYQKRIWILGAGPECDNFDDTVCDFFDLVDIALKNYRNFGITAIQNQLLVQFRGAFDEFSENNLFPEEFITTPEWKRIVEMAKQVLESFDYKRLIT